MGNGSRLLKSSKPPSGIIGAVLNSDANKEALFTFLVANIWALIGGLWKCKQRQPTSNI